MNKEQLINSLKPSKDLMDLLLIKTRSNVELAEDIYQDTYEKAIISINNGKYEDRNNMVGWLAKMALNKLVDHQRREKLNPIVTRYDVSNSKTIDTDLLDWDVVNYGNVLISDLHGAIKKLPEKQQELVQYIYFDGLKFSEVSDITNESIGTLVSRMSYAINKLKKHIKRQ